MPYLFAASDIQFYLSDMAAERVLPVNILAENCSIDYITRTEIQTCMLSSGNGKGHRNV